MLLADGKPGFVINQWVFYLLQNGVTEALLQERLRAVMHLYRFTVARYGSNLLSEHESDALLLDFLSAKRHGTINALT